MRDTSEYMSSFTVYNAQWKLIGHILGFLAVGGFFLWIGIIGYPLAFLGTAFFCLACSLTLPKLFDKSPQIIIDGKGIRDYRKKHWPNGVTIPWEDVKSIRLLRRVSGRYGRHTYITGIRLKNPQDYSQQRALISRWSQKLDRAVDYEIEGTGLTASGVDVFNYISTQQQLGRITVPLDISE